MKKIYIDINILKLTGIFQELAQTSEFYNQDDLYHLIRELILFNGLNAEIEKVMDDMGNYSIEMKGKDQWELMDIEDVRTLYEKITTGKESIDNCNTWLDVEQLKGDLVNNGKYKLLEFIEEVELGYNDLEERKKAIKDPTNINWGRLFYFPKKNRFIIMFDHENGWDFNAYILPEEITLKDALIYIYSFKHSYKYQSEKINLEKLENFKKMTGYDFLELYFRSKENVFQINITNQNYQDFLEEKNHYNFYGFNFEWLEELDQDTLKHLHQLCNNLKRDYKAIDIN